MNPLLRVNTIWVCVALLLLPLTSYGDAARFDRAVNEYLKGFRACSEANSLRLTNLTEANRKFTYYQQQLDLAVAIDESILSTSDRDMDDNLAYCQRVEDNLERAEATPILQYAFNYCESARAAYERGQFQEARQQFEEYRRYQEDAYAITATLDDVFVLSNQVRACERFEDKLAAKEAEQARYRAMLDQTIEQYQQLKLECESTLAFVNREGFSIKELGKANQMLNAALTKKKQANSHPEALRYANQNPTSDATFTLNQLMESTRICEGAVANSIRAMEKQKRQYQRSIAQQNSNLRLSLEACQTAIAATSVKNLSNASKAYQSSAILKKQVADTRAVSLVRQFPRWKESGNFNALLNKTRQCQTLAADKIKALKEDEETAKRQAESISPPTASATEENQAQSDPVPEEGSNQTNLDPLPKAEILDDLEDWEDDMSFIEEDPLDTDEDKSTGAGKSWTDLIK